MVTLLLDQGADVNTVGGRYGTALGVAVLVTTLRTCYWIEGQISTLWLASAGLY